ncbi:MAG: hypothetical protein AB7V55_03160 [Oscillospiraceae bacterium]
METTQSPQVQGRSAVHESGLYRVLNVVFTLLFFAVAVLAVAMNGNTGAGFSRLWLLVAAVAGVLGVFLLARLVLWLPAPGRTGEVVVVLVLFALLIAAQVVVGWALRPAAGNTMDFGLVHQYAVDFAQSGTYPDAYLAAFPQHTGLYFILSLYYSAMDLFGVADFTVPAFALNLVAINAAALLLYFCARRLFGVRHAILSLIGCIVTAPFVLYGAICCAESLAMVVPVALVLLWLKARSTWRAGHVGKAVGRFCVLSLVAGFGAVLLPAVLLVWLAAAIDLLVLLCGKGRVRMLLAGLAVLLAVVFASLFGIAYSGVVPRYDYDQDGVPATTWVLMGLSGNGSFDEAIFEQVQAADGAGPRVAYVSRAISARVQSLGFGGMLAHLGGKLGAVFGDGTAGASGLLAQDAAAPGGLHAVFTAGGQWYPALAYIAFAVQAALLVWLVVAALKALVRRNNALSFVRVALLLLGVLLLVWEAQPRYLVTWLPLLLLGAIEAAPVPMATGAGRVARLGPGALAAQAELENSLQPGQLLPVTQEKAAATAAIPEIPQDASMQNTAPLPLEQTQDIGSTQPLQLFAQADVESAGVPADTVQIETQTNGMEDV